MHRKLKKKYEAGERLSSFFIATLGDLSEDQLNWRPEQEKWSIFQICHHMYLAEFMPLRGMMDFSFEKSNEKLGLKSAWKSTILNLFLKSNLKAKAPKRVKEAMDQQEVTRDQLLNDWKESRVLLGEFLESFPEEKMEFFIFKHPYTGKLNVSQTLNFMNNHMIHHRRQIREIMENKNFPK